MKRRISVITAAFLAAAALTACGSKTEETAAASTQAAAAESKETEAEAEAEAEESKAPAELKELVVGASPAPHAEILEAARPVLEEKGYSLKIANPIHHGRISNSPTFFFLNSLNFILSPPPCFPVLEYHVFPPTFSSCFPSPFSYHFKYNIITSLLFYEFYAFFMSKVFIFFI